MEQRKIGNTFMRLRDEVMNDLSYKEINTKQVYDTMINGIKKDVPEEVLNFFLNSDLNIPDFKKQLAAFMDMIVKLKHFDNTRRFVINKISERQSSYQDLSAILSRYNIPFVIENGCVKVIKGDEDLSANIGEEGSINGLLNTVITDKVVNMSPTIRIEEKNQVLNLRDEEVPNPLIELDRNFEILKINDLQTHEFRVKREITPFDYRAIAKVFGLDDEDLTKLVQIDLPRTRSVNPDYLYAIGHEWAHFYSKSNYLHDRFMFILEKASKVDKKKVVISCYTDYIAAKLYDTGYKVVRGFNTSLDPEMEYWIHPDVTDFGFENYGTIPDIPDYMVTLNKHMSEVDLFKSLTNSVYYPYYLTWRKGRFDIQNYRPLVYHRPFVMVCLEDLSVQLQKCYLFTTLHLSAYRTYLQYTGAPYNFKDIYSVGVIFQGKKWFEIINEQVVQGTGHKGYMMYRETLPEFDRITETREELFGTELDYYKVIAPLLTPNVTITHNKGRSVINKRGNAIIEIRTAMKPVILRFHRYLRNLMRSRWYGPLTREDYSFSRMTRMIEPSNIPQSGGREYGEN